MNFFPTWMNDLAQHHIGQNADHGHNGCAFGEFDLGPISHCHAPSLQVSSAQDGLAILPNNIQGDVFAECGAAIQSTEDLLLHVQQHYQQQPPFQQQQHQPFLVGDAADSPQVNGALASGGAEGRTVRVPNPIYSHGIYLGGLTPAITPAQHQNNKGNYRLSTAAIEQGPQSSILGIKGFQAQGSPSVSEADTQECHGKTCLWQDSKDGLCGRICQDEEELEKHVQNDHVDKMLKTSEMVQGVLREGFFCPWHGCSRKGESKPFEQKSKIRRHMVSHTGRLAGNAGH
ncbi:zinc-finger protein [Cytospora paraplurivora]|uniref:Zinc-finger protein n=1 Tax=Cytospora paraplurivora TaxID=2898453 RepID=A0AAN9YFV4_9PEZI